MGYDQSYSVFFGQEIDLGDMNHWDFVDLPGGGGVPTESVWPWNTGNESQFRRYWVIIGESHYSMGYNNYDMADAFIIPVSRPFEWCENIRLYMKEHKLQSHIRMSVPHWIAASSGS